MCTAIRFSREFTCFGRTLDYEQGFGESVVMTPRNFPLSFRHVPKIANHYAMIGMACIAEGYPLYFDAVNEHGLAMAGLNFPGNAVYRKPREGYTNLAVFELIPWVLGQYRNAAEAAQALLGINLTDTPFSPSLPVTPLHWLLGDKKSAVTLEATAEGIHIYHNPVGVLTNNPPFPMQMQNLQSYLALSPEEPVCRFAEGLRLTPYSRGMGAMGLPGDLSSQSRFVRAAFTSLNARCDGKEEDTVTQFFHILETVSQTRGCCRLKDGSFEITRYTGCCSLDTGVYYYTTYENRQITGIDMHRQDANGYKLITWPLSSRQAFRFENHEMET